MYKPVLGDDSTRLMPMILLLFELLFHLSVDHTVRPVNCDSLLLWMSGVSWWNGDVWMPYHHVLRCKIKLWYMKAISPYVASVVSYLTRYSAKTIALEPMTLAWESCRRKLWDNKLLNCWIFTFLDAILENKMLSGNGWAIYVPFGIYVIPHFRCTLYFLAIVIYGLA